MKILHFSHNQIPDLRVERYAYLQKNCEYQVFFAGPFKPKVEGTFSDLILFKELFLLPSSRSIRFGFFLSYNDYKKKFNKIYRKLKPDIVHAHNIFTARVCLELKIPFIYDDHEFWSKQIKSRGLEPMSPFSQRRITNSLLLRKVSQWEKEVLSNAAAIIVVSEPQAEEHQKNCSCNIHIIPNYLTRYEIETIPPLKQPTNELKTVLITKGTTYSEKQSGNHYINLLSKSIFNLTVIGKVEKKISNITYSGFIPHTEVIKQLPRFHIGLMLFTENNRKANYFQYYCPNRIFLYAHAGVTPVIHPEMKFLRKIFGKYALLITEEKDIIDLIQHLESDLVFLEKAPIKIQTYAKKNFQFELLKEEIEKAYSDALSFV